MTTFRTCFKDLFFDGNKSAPRGLNVIELENYSYDLRPRERFCSFESRKLSLNYIKREFLWYLRGDRFDTSIIEHAKMWSGLVNADGSINSNYGQYVFGDTNQFDDVVCELRRDRDSRRASIVILNGEHLKSSTKDLPCTYAINFRIRNSALNMTVRMRSQDAVFGMGNDAPTFSFIHEMMYQTLKATYLDLVMGTYHHSVDSFHVYEKHWSLCEAIATKGDRFVEIMCPEMSGPEEVSFLRNGSFDVVPEKYQFARWLTTFERKGDKIEGATNV